MYPKTPLSASTRETEPGVPDDNIDIDAILARWWQNLVAFLGGR